MRMFTMPSLSASMPSHSIQCRRFCSARVKSPFGPPRIKDSSSSLALSEVRGVILLWGEAAGELWLDGARSLLARTRPCLEGDARLCGVGII